MKSLFIGLSVSCFLSLALLLILPHPAVAAETEEQRVARLVEGAKKEGTVLWYTAMELEGAEGLIKKFKEKYPFIDAKVYRASSDQVINRILAESQAKKVLVDVGSIGGISDEILKKRGFLTKYQSPENKFYPEMYKDRDGYWTSTYVNNIVIGYNTNLVPAKETPRTYDDLLDPKWKGKMGMVTNAQEWFASLLREWGEKKGIDYFKKLAAQDLSWREGATLNAQLVGSGELSIGLHLYNQRIEELKAKGVPIDWVPLDPVNSQVHPIWVSAQSPHPNAAMLFVDFSLSKEGQQYLGQEFRVPCRSDVNPKLPALKCPGMKVFVADFPNFVDDYDRYLKLFRDTLVTKK